MGFIRYALAAFLVVSQYAAAENTEKGTGVFVHGDWLYWKTRTTDLPMCVLGNLQGFISYIDQSILSVPFTYNSGFCVGGGYQVPVVEWDFLVDWTYYRNQASRSESVFVPDFGTPSRIIDPIWSNYAFAAQDMTAHQSLHYNVFDFLLRKTIIENRNTRFKAFGGVRVAYINEKLKIDSDGLTISGQLFPDAYDREYIRNKFKGTGIELGLLTDFYFTYGFGASIKGAFSLLAGSFYLKRNQTNVNGSTTVYWQGAWNQKSIAMNTDLSLQLYWEKYFSALRKCRFFAGYDLSYWPDQIQVKNLYTRFGSPADVIFQSLGHGSLSLYGYRVGAEIGF